MKNKRLLKRLGQAIHGGVSLLIVYTLITGGLLFVPQSAQASMPSSGTLNSDNTTNPARKSDGSLWMGDKTGAPPAANGESDCAANPQSCDNFILNFTGDFTNKLVRLDIKWLSPSNDYDLYVHKGSLTGTIVASSATGPSTAETVQLNPTIVGNGPFYVNVVYFAAPNAAADQYKGFVNVEAIPPAFVPPPSACTIAPTYKNFQSPFQSPNPSGTPTTLGESSGEPSIGVNWNTGNVMFQAVLQTLRVTFNDSDPTNPTATWVNRSFRTTAATTLDPIMFTDPVTGRTIPGQLAGGDSISAITDDDGETYSGAVSGGPGQGVDHQTIGGGPFKTSGFKTFDPATESFVIPTQPEAMAGPTTSYPRAFYYASQQLGYANFSTSRDGGLTYDLPRMMYTTAQCGGLHGHITVAPNDGTIYVPNKNCPGGGTVTGEPSKGKSGQGFAISEDNGNSFAVRTVPNSGKGVSDPSVAVGAGGKVYFAYTAGDKTIHVAVSDDKGVNFKFDQNIGLKTTAGLSSDPEVRRDIRATVFPQAIAGDNDRATVFFLGTDSNSMFDPTGTDGEPATGTNGTQDDFAGTWFPFMATTCNGGQSWTVIRIPDPVQQGVICTNGTTCPSGTRNLLDFNGVVVDRLGRAIAGYADGCINRMRTSNAPTTCTEKRDVTRLENDRQAKASIIRQTGGMSLFSVFDPVQ